MLWCILRHALWFLCGSNLYLILLCCLIPSALWPCAIFVVPLSFYLATCISLCWLVQYGCYMAYVCCDMIILSLYIARWYHASWLVAFYIVNGAHSNLWWLTVSSNYWHISSHLLWSIQYFVIVSIWKTQFCVSTITWKMCHLDFRTMQQWNSKWSLMKATCRGDEQTRHNALCMNGHTRH